MRQKCQTTGQTRLKCRGTATSVRGITNDASAPSVVRDAPEAPARQPLMQGDLGVDSAAPAPMLSLSMSAQQDALEHVLTIASRDAEDDVPIDSLTFFGHPCMTVRGLDGSIFVSLR